MHQIDTLPILLYENTTLHPDWEINLRTNYTYLNDDNNYIIFPPGTTLPIGSDGNLNFTNPAGVTRFPDGYIGNPDEINKTLNLEATVFYDGLAQHKVRLSTGFQQFKFEASSTQNFGPGILDGTQSSVDGTLTDVTGIEKSIYGPNTTRNLKFISIQDEWTLSRTWELTLGVRYDNYSDFGSTTNPRAALVWQTRYDLSTKLLYGRAFRAPSISELFAKNNPIAIGNPNLDPEVINTIEWAVDYQPTETLRLNANLFYYEIDGLIEFVPDASGASSTAQNARDQKAHGAELEFTWDANKQLQFSGNSAWIKAVDKKTDAMVPNVPRAQAYGNVHWEFLPKLSVDAQWFWIGYRARAVGDARQRIDDYHIVNVTLRKKDIIKNIDLAFAIRNVFNTAVREPSAGGATGAPIKNDYPMNGRSAWVEIKARF